MSELTSLPVPGRVPFEEYAAAWLRIRDKRARLVPFVLNSAQRRLLGEIRSAESEGRPKRFIILKARQLGFSTMSLGLMYEHATTTPATEAFMAAHDDESTLDLFERVRLMHDQAPIRPMTRYSNRRELDFSNPRRKDAKADPGLMSRIRVGTAGKSTLGRSKTVRYLHCSEVAFWENAGRVLLGLEQALPDDRHTVEIIESTANGVGGEFYERWQRASNPETRGDWRAVFFAWFDDPEYRRPVESGVMNPVPSCVVDVELFLREERELKALFNLDDEQLNWRRWAIVNRCGNSLEMFRQEYPSTPEEAFLTTGRPVFNQQALNFRKRGLMAEDLRRKGEKRSGRWVAGRIVRGTVMPRFLPDEGGDLRVYEFPKPQESYVISADVAEGITKGKDSDSSALQVFRRGVPVVQVASWSGRIPPSEFASMLVMLGYWYNKALLAVESNNHGHTVNTLLVRAKYSRIHMRVDLDRFGPEVLERPGWETNKKTRPILVDAAGDAILGTVQINDIPTIDQMLTFVHNEKSGKPEGDKGCHDDLVLAFGIGCAVLQMARVPVEVQRGKPLQPLNDLDAMVWAHQRALLGRKLREQEERYA